MTPDALGRRFRSSLARFMSSAPQPGAGVSTAVDSPDAGSAAILPPFEERVRALQKALALPFDNPGLLREALTHRSYLNEVTMPVPSNERLEFLGDAVLGLISADFLYERFPNMPEGDLTNLRSALVRTETLASYAGELSLGNYLFLGRGEELSAGRYRPTGLAGAFEALVGAIYLDQGYSAARLFALRFLEPQLGDVLAGQTQRNAKSVLQEMVQARTHQAPTYHVIEESGPDHAKSFTVEVRVGEEVLGRGHERSKRAAEQAAAAQGIEHMRNLESDGV